MRTMSYTSFPTYTLTPVIQSALIHLSIYLFPSTPQYGLGNAVAGPVWPDRAVADPVGRVTPPQRPWPPWLWPWWPLPSH
jgi:hypothetical protein